MSDIKAYVDELIFELATTKARLTEAERKLREQAQEAYEDVGHWGGYASGYFSDKWNLAGDLQKWKDRAAPPPADSADECEHMYVAKAGSAIGTGFCVKCGAQELPDCAIPVASPCPICGGDPSDDCYCAEDSDGAG